MLYDQGTENSTISKRDLFVNIYVNKNHLNFRKTLISFSKDSSFPFKAFLSMHLMATIAPGLGRHSARKTREKAPVPKVSRNSYRSETDISFDGWLKKRRSFGTGTIEVVACCGSFKERRGIGNVDGIIGDAIVAPE
jgi:hypothetical protein